jgi:hypothetical protein
MYKTKEDVRSLVPLQPKFVISSSVNVQVAERQGQYNAEALKISCSMRKAEPRRRLENTHTFRGVLCVQTLGQHGRNRTLQGLDRVA